MNSQCDVLIGPMQPCQNGPAAGQTSRLLWEFDRLLAIRKCIILLTTRRKEKRKKTERTFKPEMKISNHYLKGLKALV